MGGKGKMTTERVRDAIMSAPCLALSPSQPPLTFSLSLSPSNVLLLPASSLHLSVLSLSFTPSTFTSTLSVFFSFSLSVVLFFILSSSVCHLYSGETWRPRAPVKYNCRYVCVCVCVHTHAHVPVCLLVLWQYALTQSDLHK